MNRSIIKLSKQIDVKMRINHTSRYFLSTSILIMFMVMIKIDINTFNTMSVSNNRRTITTATTSSSNNNNHHHTTLLIVTAFVYVPAAAPSPPRMIEWCQQNRHSCWNQYCHRHHAATTAIYHQEPEKQRRKKRRRTTTSPTVFSDCSNSSSSTSLASPFNNNNLDSSSIDKNNNQAVAVQQQRTSLREKLLGGIDSITEEDTTTEPVLSSSSLSALSSTSSRGGGESAAAAATLSWKFPAVVGHRGCLYEELENTRQGFINCNRMGCDAIELDVFQIPVSKTNRTKPKKKSKSSNNTNNNSNRVDTTIGDAAAAAASDDDDDNATELIVFHGGGPDDNPGWLDEYCTSTHNNNDNKSLKDGTTIYDYDLDSIQGLQFNTMYKEFPCPIEKIQYGTIPTLRDVLLDAKKQQQQHYDDNDNDDSATNTNTNGNRKKSRRRNKARKPMEIKIELKGPANNQHNHNLVQNILQLVDELDMVEQCSYSSFILDHIKLIRQLRPQINIDTGQYVYRTGALFNNVCTITGRIVVEREEECTTTTDSIPTTTTVVDVAKECGASEIHLRYDTCSRALIQQIHDAGFRTMGWVRGPMGMSKDITTVYNDINTIVVGDDGDDDDNNNSINNNNAAKHQEEEDRKAYEILIETGVQQLCVNKPKLLLQMKQQYQKQQNKDRSYNDDDD